MSMAYAHDYAFRIISESGILVDESLLSFEECNDRANEYAQIFYDNNYRYDRNVHTYFSRIPGSVEYRIIQIISPEGIIYNA